MLNNEIWLACDELHLEKAELIVDAVELVDDSPDLLIFLFLRSNKPIAYLGHTEHARPKLPAQ